MLVAAVGAQLPGASASESAVGAGAEEITLRLLYQLIVILLATRLVTAVVRRLGQTEVSGEILAGLLLGPSLLGALFPDLMHTLFPPSTGPIFTGLAQIGLIFLMFQIGLEFEFTRHLGGSRRPIVGISLILGAVSCTTWALFGTALRPILTSPKAVRAFNVVMALLLLASLYPVFMDA